MACPCPYANVLGIPGQGIHSYRIFGLAAVDIALTILAAAITSWIYSVPFLYSFAGWFIIGEVLHCMFGVKTAFLKMIGLEPSCIACSPSS
jgi:hypothetical protein